MVSKRFQRRLLLTLAGFLVLAFVGAGAAWWGLQASLAQLDGRRVLPGLSRSVTVERDALGVPTVRASNRVDAARALGFLHAQERFFQMDLLRRQGAGELAGLFGPALVEADREARLHRLRASARASLDLLTATQRDVLEAYVAGVNTGLNALRVRPPEYLLLRSVPEPWQPEDSLLVGGAMFFALQDAGGAADLARGAIARVLPGEAARFFFPKASEWDAALDDTLLPAPPVPSREVFDLSRPTAVKPGAASVPAPAPLDPQLIPGSNAWGLGGEFSKSGAAIVANDMHLDLGMPNIWFRASLEWTAPNGQSRRLVGVTLPGIPSLIVGSNGEIAWGFTNAELDTTDVVVLELNPTNPRQYRTPDGWKEFEVVTESIRVRGAPAVEFPVERTIWGPVFVDAAGVKRVIRWVPQLPGAMNLGLLEMENVTSTAQALALAPTCGIPLQNFLVGDRQGSLGWTLIGRLPKRIGFDGNLPVSWADGSCRWDGWLAPESYPRVDGTRTQRLWTANNRILGSSDYVNLGPWTTDLGARARQIRDDLRSLKAPASEPDLMTIHRDDRALFLARWQELLFRTLRGGDGGTNAAAWRELQTQVQNWGGRAATNSVGYRAVRIFRLRAMERLMEPVLSRCEAAQTNVGFHIARHEGPCWTLLQERPVHLLNSKYADYEALLADAAMVVLEDFQRLGVPLAQATWGSRIATRIQHPVSRAIPALGRWLDMPSTQLPGDDHMPRVQGARFGASERIVVAPGHEESGLFHMPSGQSGHFLSPFYRAGHAAWERVEPTPLLPGPIQYTLVLEP